MPCHPTLSTIVILFCFISFFWLPPIVFSPSLQIISVVKTKTNKKGNPLSRLSRLALFPGYRGPFLDGRVCQLGSRRIRYCFCRFAGVAHITRPVCHHRPIFHLLHLPTLIFVSRPPCFDTPSTLGFAYRS